MCEVIGNVVLWLLISTSMVATSISGSKQSNCNLGSVQVWNTWLTNSEQCQKAIWRLDKIPKALMMWLIRNAGHTHLWQSRHRVDMQAGQLRIASDWGTGACGKAECGRVLPTPGIECCSKVSLALLEGAVVALSCLDAASWWPGWGLQSLDLLFFNSSDIFTKSE